MAGLGAKNKPVSSSDTGNGPGWIRTSEGSRQRVYSPFVKNGKGCNNKDLHKDGNTAYKPAYKKIQKNAQNHPENLPDDLAEIVRIWDDLPEHIKQSIKSLVKSVNKDE